MAQCFALFLLVILLFSNSAAGAKDAVAHGKNKRELPLSLDCNLLTESCSKGDLIAKNIADCERDASFFNIFTCDPIDDHSFHNVVDVPDVSKHGVNCVATRNLPITCGATIDTRCVCDSPFDAFRPLATLANRCRCQYWPEQDIRANQPSYCTQYDKGGISGLHFFTCCNNCNDADKSCDGRAYQGGGATNEYCSTCGQNSATGEGRMTYRFNCVNCAQQALCERKCSTNLSALIRHIPGLCYLWVRCFRHCCLEATNSRHVSGLEEKSEFCGDFVCQTGEDRFTCPTDCCPNHNPNGCGLLHRNPDPDCCYEPDCCV